MPDDIRVKAKLVVDGDRLVQLLGMLGWNERGLASEVTRSGAVRRGMRVSLDSETVRNWCDSSGSRLRGFNKAKMEAATEALLAAMAHQCAEGRMDISELQRGPDLVREAFIAEPAAKVEGVWRLRCLQAIDYEGRSIGISWEADVVLSARGEQVSGEGVDSDGDRVSFTGEFGEAQLVGTYRISSKSGDQSKVTGAIIAALTSASTLRGSSASLPSGLQGQTPWTWRLEAERLSE